MAVLVITRPSRYCEIESGEANRLRKLRDHTSSRNTPDTPCMTRVKKSKSSTAPRSVGTKFSRAAVMPFRYLLM